MEKVIHKKFQKCCVVNKRNKIIKNLISDNYILNDLDNLPSNIFDNVSLYLGDKYETIDINLFQFKEYLFSNIQFEKERSYWDKNFISIENNKYIYFVMDKIFLITDFKSLKELLTYTNKEYKDSGSVISTLIAGLIEQKFNVLVISVVTKL